VVTRDLAVPDLGAQDYRTAVRVGELRKNRLVDGHTERLIGSPDNHRIGPTRVSGGVEVRFSGREPSTKPLKNRRTLPVTPLVAPSPAWTGDDDAFGYLGRFGFDY